MSGIKPAIFLSKNSFTTALFITGHKDKFLIPLCRASRAMNFPLPTGYLPQYSDFSQK